jgi:hypothetical protein
MTTYCASEPVPVPIRVLLPGDQEVVAHLWSRRQAPGGWRYEVGLPAYRNGPGDSVEPAKYRVLAVYSASVIGRAQSRRSSCGGVPVRVIRDGRDRGAGRG